MYNPMFDDIKMMAEADIKEIVGKGSIEAHEYPCLGEAIDIVKDIHKIKQMCLEEEAMMMGEEGGEDMMSYASGRMPRYNMRMSNARGGSSREGSYESSYAQGGSNGSYAQGGSNNSYAQGGSNRGGSREGSYEGQGGSNGSYEQGGSQYNPNRSSITGRYTSRDGASYHDMDGSMKKDLEELLSKAKDDHERMLLMRVMSKIEQ